MSHSGRKCNSVRKGTENRPTKAVWPKTSEGTRTGHRSLLLSVSLNVPPPPSGALVRSISASPKRLLLSLPIVGTIPRSSRAHVTRLAWCIYRGTWSWL